jgi:hypothetical protein
MSGEEWPEILEVEMPTAEGPRSVFITLETLEAQARLLGLEDACENLRGHVWLAREARHRAERRVAFWRVAAAGAGLLAVAAWWRAW